MEGIIEVSSVFAVSEEEKVDTKILTNELLDR